MGRFRRGLARGFELDLDGRMVRRMLQEGASQKTIARHLGLSASAVARIAANVRDFEQKELERENATRLAIEQGTKKLVHARARKEPPKGPEEQPGLGQVNIASDAWDWIDEANPQNRTDGDRDRSQDHAEATDDVANPVKDFSKWSLGPPPSIHARIISSGDRKVP